MKILRVITSMDPASGGPCQGIRNSIPSLEKLGAYNEVVCLDSPGAEFLKNDPFVVNAIGPRKGPWSYCPSLIPWLLSNFHRFDVIIAHGLWLFQTYAVRKALLSYKKKNVDKKLPAYYVMPHGMLDPYFQISSERRLKALRNRIYWKLIESKVINSANGLLFTCQEELELARKTFVPYSPKKELNIGYGVPAPPLFNIEMKLAFEAACPQVKGRNYILFLSRVHNKKGVELLISAYRKIISVNAAMPCLIIAGPGLETPYGKEMLNIVQNDSVLKNRIFFPGMLSGNSKWGAFYGCDAFVLPSHQENFGIAVVEALACSKPVLISNQVNICQEIKEGGGGYVASDSEAGVLELFEKWSNLKEDDRLLFGQNAKAIYEKHFRIEVAAKKMLDALSANMISANHVENAHV